MLDFIEFPKMARLSREIIVTEKIDGTNAQVHVRFNDGVAPFDPAFDIEVDGMLIRAGSRSRWISATDDNFGFAA